MKIILRMEISTEYSSRIYVTLAFSARSPFGELIHKFNPEQSSKIVKILLSFSIFVLSWYLTSKYEKDIILQRNITLVISEQLKEPKRNFEHGNHPIHESNCSQCLAVEASLQCVEHS
jgi:hypothetical protein